MSTVIWHDLECGRYRQDLSLWLELAMRAVADGGSVLDVGCGTGRVTVPLAQAGHHVVGLDREPELLTELERRAGGLPVETVCADARDFSLPGRSFGLVIVPMQTIQLLGGAPAHCAFFRSARAHLGPGGLVAVAIAAAEDFEEFEWREGDLGPLPDIAEVAGCAYFSQPTAVRRADGTFVLERHREVVEPDGRRRSSDDHIELDIVTVADLQQAAATAGMHAQQLRRVEPTDEHIGSEVVIFGG